MSDDEAFIAAIREAPHDDAPRLVYADWLEENGHAERAEYLWLVHGLTHWPEDDSRRRPASERLVGLRQTVDPEWRERVGRRFDLILVGLNPAKKIPCARALRWASGLGLVAVRDIVEREPGVIVYGALREDVERLKDRIVHQPWAYYPLEERDLELEIRPSSEHAARLSGEVPESSFDLILVRFSPEKRAEVLAWIQRTVQGRPDFSFVLLEQLPSLIQWSYTREELDERMSASGNPLSLPAGLSPGDIELSIRPTAERWRL